MLLKLFYLNCLAHASCLIGDEDSHTAAVVDPGRGVELCIERTGTTIHLSAEASCAPRRW